jgi:Adenylate and Guanylate cyclase catalytic domain
LVVVGDLIGSGEAQERGIVGDTPNLAARLQCLAEPNSVVVAESTRKLLGNLFDLQDLGAQDLKGIAGPVRTWAALRASSVASRFEAPHATGLTALKAEREARQAGILAHGPRFRVPTTADMKALFASGRVPEEVFKKSVSPVTARPPLNPVVVGHKKLGPACPGLFSSENNGALTELRRRHNCGGSKKESYMPQYWASIARLPIGRRRRCRALRG